jgi:seryl-tRNA synthetase
MFGVSKPSDSEKLLEEFLDLEEESFSKLGLQLRTLDMPQEELGAQAYRKYDVEAYMPGKDMWGELSSTSNCTDYQSRRLGVRSAESGEFLHTVNGTACAVPRLIIAILETHQNPDKTVNVPQPLVPYMGINTIGRSRVNKIEMYRAHNELE